MGTSSNSCYSSQWTINSASGSSGWEDNSMANFYRITLAMFSSSHDAFDVLDRFIGCMLGCSKMHQSQNFKVAVSQSWLLYQTKSLQKDFGFFLQKCGIAQFFSFLMGISGDFNGEMARF